MSSQPKFSWYELLTTDVDSAKAFYSSIIPWSTQFVGTPQMPYSTFNVDGRGVAGIMNLPPQAGPKPAWSGYIHLLDVDAAAQRVADAGGSIHRPPTDVPGMLRFSVVVDPQGAPFVLFTANPQMDSPPPPPPGTPGTVGWNELLTPDSAAAFDFYTTQFGWTEGDSFDMGAIGPYRIFKVDGVQNGGIMNTPPGTPGAFWNFYFQVESCSAVVDRIHAGGGKVVNGPHEVPGGQWIVTAIDPQGASFALVSNAP
jgi:predicted enzyme related to lactoylglutathione lyase